LLLLAASVLAIGCTPKRPSHEDRADASAPRVVEPPKVPVVLSLFADTKIEAGLSQTGFQIGTYRIRREEGDPSKTFLDAAALCKKGGRALCTEAQWSPLRHKLKQPSIGQHMGSA
jgi:hypothetical protein